MGSEDSKGHRAGDTARAATLQSLPSRQTPVKCLFVPARDETGIGSITGAFEGAQTKLAGSGHYAPRPYGSGYVKI